MLYVLPENTPLLSKVLTQDSRVVETKIKLGEVIGSRVSLSLLSAVDNREIGQLDYCIRSANAGYSCLYVGYIENDTRTELNPLKGVGNLLMEYAFRVSCLTPKCEGRIKLVSQAHDFYFKLGFKPHPLKGQAILFDDDQLNRELGVQVHQFCSHVMVQDTTQSQVVFAQIIRFIQSNLSRIREDKLEALILNQRDINILVRQLLFVPMKQGANQGIDDTSMFLPVASIEVKKKQFSIEMREPSQEIDELNYLYSADFNQYVSAENHQTLWELCETLVVDKMRFAAQQSLVYKYGLFQENKNRHLGIAPGLNWATKSVNTFYYELLDQYQEESEFSINEQEERDCLPVAS